MNLEVTCYGKGIVMKMKSKRRVNERERKKFRKFFEKQKEWNGLLKEYGNDILMSDNFLKTRDYIQHGNMTVNSHCSMIIFFMTGMISTTGILSAFMVFTIRV